MNPGGAAARDATQPGAGPPSKASCRLRRPRFKNRADPLTLDQFDLRRERLEGQLFYEGAAPPGALVFAAPLDAETYHVIVFTVSDAEDQAATPASSE
ncbi:MAG: hypothetical protein CMJ58_27900 [Planctomycetaceae bacterium]|nr:hypothetical protein [Planctomycetaceae bacterium]